MPKLWMLLAAVGVLAGACPAAAQQEEKPGLLFGGPATPNFLGTTGLLLTPSAYTVGDKGFSAHAAGGSAFNSFGVQFGVTSRFELGATYLDSDDFRGDSGLLVNAKFALLKESLAWPQISVGVTDVFDQTGLDPSWYAVASKGLVLGLRAHAGYGGGVYNDRPFFGLEWDMGSNPKLGLIGEYVDRDVNLGIRARVGGFSGTVGVFDFDEWGFSISYTGGLRL